MATYKELYAQAKALNILGRSDMNKERLQIAVEARQAYNDKFFPKKKKEVVVPPALVPLWKQLDELIDTDKLSCCHYAFKNIDGYVFRPNDICFAAFRGGDITECVMNLSLHLKQSKHPDLYEQWVDYVLFRSPFKAAFIPPSSVDEALMQGVYGNCDMSTSHIVSGWTAIRHASEFPWLLPTWKKLMDWGASEQAAFFMCHMLDLAGNTPIFKFADGSHKTFNFCRQSLEGVAKFFKEGFYNKIGYGPAKVDGYGFVVCNCVAPQAQQKKIYLQIPEMMKVKEADGWNEAGKPTEEKIKLLIPVIEKMIQ